MVPVVRNADQKTFAEIELEIADFAKRAQAGIHATKERPVVVNGEIVIRPMNYLALSYDHRLIDGREAVLGLGAMKAAIEDPAVMLLDI